uniref:Uncharacterized protein n=1 Tax=Rhizophora mucronata TaxID=61149 RepID=A0A2P2NGG2_RHIMU
MTWTCLHVECSAIWYYIYLADEVDQERCVATI